MLQLIWRSIIEIEDGNIYSDNNPLTEDTVTESQNLLNLNKLLPTV